MSMIIYMYKDFDMWNNQKKHINYYKQRKNYHAGDVWWMHTGLNIGFEQDGKHKNFERPCLIIKGFNKEVCLVVSLSTIPKNNKFYVSIGIIEDKEAYAIISQIKLIDTKRLVNQIGFVSNEVLFNIKNQSRISLIDFFIFLPQLLQERAGLRHLDIQCSKV